jgi:hypothetical protein
VIQYFLGRFVHPPKILPEAQDLVALFDTTTYTLANVAEVGAGGFLMISIAKIFGLGQGSSSAMLSKFIDILADCWRATFSITSTSNAALKEKGIFHQDHLSAEFLTHLRTRLQLYFSFPLRPVFLDT